MKQKKQEPKAGDLIRITKTPDYYGIQPNGSFEFFQVGDLAVLTQKDRDGDWMADFSNQNNPFEDKACDEWCVSQVCDFEVVEP